MSLFSPDDLLKYQYPLFPPGMITKEPFGIDCSTSCRYLCIFFEKPYCHCFLFIMFVCSYLEYIKNQYDYKRISMAYKTLIKNEL